LEDASISTHNGLLLLYSGHFGDWKMLQ